MKLGNVLDFEAFNLKDMWKKIRKDPERLLMGAVDPWSTKLWNKVTGSDYEPIVDQMGGAYGGHTLSWGPENQDGGVYARARAAGIDTTEGAFMHDLSHQIAQSYAMNAIPNGAGGGTDWQGLTKQGLSLYNASQQPSAPQGALTQAQAAPAPAAAPPASRYMTKYGDALRRLMNTTSPGTVAPSGLAPQLRTF